MLASSRVLHCCCCRHCADVVALAAWASLPLSCWCRLSYCTHVATSNANWRLPSHDGRHRPCLPCVTTSIANWRPPSPNAIVPRHPCLHCAGVSAGIALLFLPASHWRHHQPCAVIVAGNMLALPPSLRGHLRPLSCWRFCPCHPHVAASILKWHLPSPTAVTTHWCTWHRCRLLVIANGLVAILGVTPWQLGL